MGYMQVVKTGSKDKETEYEPVGPILGVKPEIDDEIWLPVIETNAPVDPTFQKRKYVYMGTMIMECVVTDESKVYLAQRLAAYPSIESQLDMIYHEGVDAWKEKIAEIKEAFPKPSE